MHPREIERELPKFEGLIFTTATMIVAQVDLDLDDIRQRLRVKVWKSLRDYRRDKSRRSRRTDDERLRSWVFSCVTDEKKDILKKRRDNWLYIEDEAPPSEGHAEGSPRDTFEGRYMRVEDFTVEDTVTLPSTIDEGERQVILLLYAGRSRAEAMVVLGLSKREIEATIKRVREKLADWRPSPSERLLEPPPVLVVLAALLETPCSGARERRPVSLPAGRTRRLVA